MLQDFVFTSESVTEGHPDKLCDQISDTIVDQCLREDRHARVIAECAVSTGVVFIAARFATTAAVDVAQVARQVIRRIGYLRDDFNARTCSVMTSLNELPWDHFQRLDEEHMSDAEIDAVAATNQVTVFGFACTQTAALMPLPIWLAHKLARRMSTARLTRRLAYLDPDGQVQVAVEFRGRRPHRIHSLTLLSALDERAAPDAARLREDFQAHVIEPAFHDEPVRPDGDTNLVINPGDAFLVGGPSVHAGLTGRKTAIDTYGAYSRFGGAALSGKDPSRIDRVGPYAARHAAKNVIAAGLAHECEVQLSYSIGRARPVSLQVETYGTGIVDEAEIAKRLQRHFDFRPAAIVKAYGLRRLPAQARRGFYARLAAYGHVGRMDLGLPWERTDGAAALHQ